MSDSIEALQQAVEDLQSRLAYQEQMLDDLNDVISKQDQIILNMQKKFEADHVRLEDLIYNQANKGDEKPPHY